MSDILFTCPECSKSLAVDEAGTGCTIPCSDCGAAVVVPSPETGFECPTCGCRLWTSAGLDEETFLCPGCDAEIPLPHGVLQTEGGTVRVKRGSRSPSQALPPVHVNRGEAPADPPKLFSARPSNDSAWPESRRVVRGIWLIVFGCAVLLVLLIYMDVFFDAGLSVLSTFGSVPATRSAGGPGPETQVEPLETTMGGTQQGPPPAWYESTGRDVAPGEVFRPRRDEILARPLAVEPVVSEVSTSGPVELPVVVVTPRAVEFDPQLLAMRSIYERQVSRLKAIQTTNTLQWAEGYVATLERIRQSMQAAGNLDGWVATGKEINRFADDATPPDASQATGAELLDAARVEARTRYDASLDSFSREVVALGNKYIAHLAEIQSGRTRDGEFAAAMLVSDEIRHVREDLTHAAAEFHLATVGADRRAAAISPKPEAGDGGSGTNETTSPRPAVDSSSRHTEPSISRGSASPPLPGVTYERLSIKPSGPIQSRRNYEISVMCGVSSNLQSRALSTGSRSGQAAETALLHHVVIGLRTTSRTHVIRAPRLRIEYFVSGIGPAEGRSTPRRLTIDEVDMEKLDNEWVYIDCPPVETRQFKQSFEGSAFTRQTTGGDRFHGVIVTVLEERKRPVFEATAAAMP